MLSTLSIPGELFQQNDWLRNSIYEMAGVSQLMLAAKVQPGMESAVGVRAVADQQAGRFRKASDALDETYMVIARKHIALAKKIPGYKVVAQYDDHAYEVAWNTLNPKILHSRFKVWPTNLMQGSPSMQMEMAEKLNKLGVVPPRSLVRMFRVNDMKKATDSITASEQVMEMLIERMTDPDNPTYKGPEEFMDLEGALAMAQNAYLMAWRKNASPKSLGYLINFMRAADEMNKDRLAKLADVQAAAQAAQMASIQAQQAPPAAAPTQSAA